MKVMQELAGAGPIRLYSILYVLCRHCTEYGMLRAGLFLSITTFQLHGRLLTFDSPKSW